MTMSLLKEAVNSLCFALFKELKEDEENIFFSPFSISTALSMLFSGACGHTEEEIRRALQFERVGISSSDVHSHFQQLLSCFKKDLGHMTLTFANALLMQKNLPVSPEFKGNLDKNYQALLLDVDFAGENAETLKKINDWVKEKTNQMIQKFVDSLEPSTVMVILNAVYFKGLWKFPFDSNDTRERLFYNRGQSDQGKQVPMMFMRDAKFRYVEKENYKALELPYKNDAIVMLLLLPKEFNGLCHLEDLLTSDLLKDTMNSFHVREVDVTLPKFKIEYSKQLSGKLINLGMNSAFEGSANFSGICDNVYLSEVLTKSVLIVNEEGTEAAAVTGGMMFLCMKYNETFLADHPFLFIIYDREKDMILFIGRVMEF